MVQVEMKGALMEQSLTSQTIAESLQERYPSEVEEIVTFRDQVSVKVKKARIREILAHLHDTPEFSFDYLVDLFGVDYLGKKEPRFEVVYIICSLRNKNMLRIRAGVSEDDELIDSVTSIWNTANWLERECFDMLGIGFEGHPDLRRILMPEDWEGYPLRKDYPLKSDLGEREWKALKEIKELSETNRKYELK
jgi:NADH-quinone oxidoreductase subunit C